jgi:hypothetical protein
MEVTVAKLDSQGRDFSRELTTAGKVWNFPLFA